MPLWSKEFRQQTLALFGTPTGALFVVMLAEGFAFFATTYWETPQYYQAVLLTWIPAIACIIYAAAGFVRGRLERKVPVQNHDPERIVASQLLFIWGPPLNTLDKLISLCEERVSDAQDRLEEEKKGEPSSLFEVTRTGFKCVQVARAILVLCKGGYSDQAYALSRSLVEQRVNVGFILTSGKIEEVAQRYIDWEKAKFYRFIKRTKDRRDQMGQGPTDEEWEFLTTEYRALKEKYKDSGDIDKKEEWAIAYRDGMTRIVKAFSVVDRAKHSMPQLKSDKNHLFEIWNMEWQDLNEFTHTTPRSIHQSLSTPRENVVGSGRSSIGLIQPIRVAAVEILNLSSALAFNLTSAQSLQTDTFSQEAMETLRKLMRQLEEIPEAARPWHHRSSNADSRPKPKPR